MKKPLVIISACQFTKVLPFLVPLSQAPIVGVVYRVLWHPELWRDAVIVAAAIDVAPENARHGVHVQFAG